jgi:hypothetical protein
VLLHAALAEKIIDVRVDELRHAAGRRRGRRTPAERFGRTVRQGLGWLLVEVGLRLALPAED